MLDGEVDIAGTSEYPVVLNIFIGNNISILATDNKIQTIHLIGRKDHGIVNMTDLKGKNIGIAHGTINEFYLNRFLNFHGLEQEDVTLVDLRPPQFADAIEAGSIDAVICSQPHVSEITGQMGDTVVDWPAQNNQPVYGIFVARTDWALHNPETVTRFLRSIDVAAHYTACNPRNAQDIVKKLLNLSDTYMDSRWSQNQFSLSLVLAMEDEARWMIANNLTNATAVPDFTMNMYPDALLDLNPGFVNIIISCSHKQS